MKKTSHFPKTSQSLIQNELSTETIIESLSGIFYLFDKDCHLLFWNKNFEETVGYPATKLYQMSVKDFFNDDNKKLIFDKLKSVSVGEKTSFEAELLTANKDLIPFFFDIKKVLLNNVVHFLGTGKDISFDYQVRRSLVEAEERYSAFIENSSEGIWHLEMKVPIPIELSVEEQIKLLYENSFIAECNNVKARQYGFTKAEELIGKSLEELFVRSDTNNYRYLSEFIKSGYRLLDDETHEKDRDGEDRFFLSSLMGIVENSRLTRAWGTQRDITAIKQARQTFLESEEQLRRSQKVEAIGRLAGGIAHDFNNFLAVIMLHVDMLSLQLPAGSPLRFRVEEIRSVTNNAAGMVRQLLAFGRKQTLQPHPVILNHIAQEFVKILRPLLGEDIEINLMLSPDLGVCLVDPDQVTQVLMNLAVNARDAMPKGGKLEISTTNVVLDKNNIRLRSQPVGEYVQLAVTETGVGMDEATRKRIFEPFFTTKEPNKGTGLGLSTVYGIIKQSNGFIWVGTEPGNGTSFEIQFPRIDQPATSLVKENPSTMPTGHETILLVEDEEHVRRATVEALHVLGYQVLEAADGKQAIEIAKKFQKPIHLLLTDVVMPGINGRELAKKIQSLHFETAVLYMSGYDDDIISNGGTLEENVFFLNKPFSPLTLADKIRETLEKS